MCSVVLFCAGLKACKKLIVYAKFGFKYSNWWWGCVSPVLRAEPSKGWDKGLDGGSQEWDRTGWDRMGQDCPAMTLEESPVWVPDGLGDRWPPQLCQGLVGSCWGLWVKLWDVPCQGIGTARFWSTLCLEGTLPCAGAVASSR